MRWLLYQKHLVPRFLESIYRRVPERRTLLRDGLGLWGVAVGLIRSPPGMSLITYWLPENGNSAS
jgi:hypothetical protein